MVTEKLNLVASSLPAEIETPVLAPVSSIMGEILFIALESDRHSPIEIRTVADTTLRRRLLAVPGVSQVTSIGGAEKRYEVVVSPEKLRTHNLTLAEVEDTLRQANQNTSAGFQVQGGQEYLIQGLARVANVEEIGDTVVASRSFVPIRIRDLAEVRVGEAIKRGEGSHNGKPAVIVGIQKQPGANTLELTRTLDQVLDDVQHSLPSGMTIDKQIFRQADFIDRSIDNLTHALRDGGHPGPDRSAGFPGEYPRDVHQSPRDSAVSAGRRARLEAGWRLPSTA